MLEFSCNKCKKGYQRAVNHNEGVCIACDKLHDDLNGSTTQMRICRLERIVTELTRKCLNLEDSIRGRNAFNRKGV